MANPPSRDALRTALEQRGLPLMYIERLLGKLDDHYTDLVEERRASMGAARKLQTIEDEQTELQQRIGEPAQLAVFAAEQYRARSFWGRHRVLTFVIGPLPLAFVLWIAVATGIVWTGMGIAYACEQWLGLTQDTWQPQYHLWGQAAMMVFVSWLIIVFPPLTAAALLCRTARRNAVNWRWPIVACTLLALVIGFLNVGYRVAIAPNDGRLVLGINFESSAQWVLLSYLPKFAVALGIGLLLIKRAQWQMKLDA